MTFKSLLVGGLLALGLGFGSGLAVDSAEAKTRVYIGVGNPYPYYDCYNPGYIDWCGNGFYRPAYRYHPRRSRFYNDDDYYVDRRNSCRSAARAIRNAGYRNVRAVDCNGRIYGFKATKRGKRYSLRVNSLTGRISVNR
jgi:hypothetical protein